jgi:hypothetical protein
LRRALVGWICAALIAGSGGRAAAFDRGAWLADLDQAHAVFASKYANLEWQVTEREADPQRWFDDARVAIEAADNDADARAAFERLVRRTGDGHVEIHWPKPAAARNSPAGPCAALGFSTDRIRPPLLSYAPGYRPLPSAAEFPAGVITRAGRRVGVVRIELFDPQFAPALCQAGLKALAIPAAGPCDAACSDRLETWLYDRLTVDFAASLEAVRAGGAQVLVLDETDNGGGSEWGEAAMRMLTPLRLVSEQIGFVRGRHWTDKWAHEQADLRAAAAAERGADRALLLRLADLYEQRRLEAAAPCDSGPLWRKSRPACAWTPLGVYATGAVASAAPERFRGKSWGTLVFSPSQFPYREGVWRGPLIVLVDGDTYSAAEGLAAVLQDDRAAVVMGAPTGGAGCGHTDGGTPTTLDHSGAILILPDCVRLRADGSNEVSGVQPDVLAGLRRYDSPRRRAALVDARLAEAVRRAIALNAPGRRGPGRRRTG